MNRRDFCSLIAAASGAWPARAQDSPSRRGFPAGDYTPFGYLDNPWHSWDLHRSGVLRSLPGIGFSLYYPAGPGGYFDYARNGIYEASLSLGFLIGGRVFRALEDFGSALTAPHHTKNLLAYEFSVAGVRVTSTFAQADEDSLAVRVELRELSGQAQPVRVIARQTYRLGGASWWGRDGLAGQFDSDADALWIRSFAAGTVFAIAGSRTSAAHFLDKVEQEWLKSPSIVSEATSYHPQPLHGALRYDLQLTPNSRAELTIVMARAANAHAATAHARASLAGVAEQIARKRAEDDAFWGSAPQLTGDWPAHWKHGWVYDFETLRMMVRRPIGVYKHPWDAMQIQAPRNVLAETSIDMWALSYADPETAKSVFLGQFLDALADNIPCMREDGVMNMVAADGSECGTSISWCYPFFCAASIFDRTRDLSWLRQLYPGLARLLRWTLAHRVDSGGFVVGKCSWETGMDASKRFLIEQPTGGELTEFVRLVELQAAAAQAGAILARFARLAGDMRSASEWQSVQRAYSRKTQELWRDGWFHDFDTRTMQLVTSVGPDPAQSAPAFCGVATEDQMRRMLATLRDLFDRSRARGRKPAEGWDDGLAWSSLMLPYLESIWSAGDGELAAEVISTVADRIYTSTDRRAIGPEHPGENRPAPGWPGVSCEIWGAHGAFGGEGYGWGAVMPAHIIRSLIGFRETGDDRRILICPNLPASWLRRDKRYGIVGLHFGSGRLDLHFQVLDGGEIRIEGEWSGPVQAVSVTSGDARPRDIRKDSRKWQFVALNHQRYTVELRH